MLTVLKKTKALNRALVVLKRGGVVICPTDTVYGFLADASNRKAVEKLYKIKKRPKSKPLPVFVANTKMAKELAEIDARQEKTVKKYWPGKYTFVLKRKPAKLYGISKTTIALRIPKDAFLQKLLKKIHRPLVQTSVNISTEAPLNNVPDILTVFGSSKAIGLVIDGGNLKKAKSSQVMDFTGKKLARLR